MQSDLQKLYITKEDLKNITDVSSWDLKAYERLKYPRLVLLGLIGEYVQQVLLLGWGLIPIGYLIKWKWFRKRQKNIFDEVEQYNTVIKAIDINDQLAEAGNQGATLIDREKVIATLEAVRANLISSLKTEQILRKNKELIANNERLASSLATVQTLQVKNDADEYTKLLNEALQAAQEVQAEMRKLDGDEKS
jgi:hypothetical protein